MKTMKKYIAPVIMITTLETQTVLAGSGGTPFDDGHPVPGNNGNIGDGSDAMGKSTNFWNSNDNTWEED
jgi:hypothetical protein